jgi:hypothetical protein
MTDREGRPLAQGEPGAPQGADALAYIEGVDSALQERFDRERSALAWWVVPGTQLVRAVQ